MSSLKDYSKAAMLIKKHGIAGANRACLLTGTPVVLGMLIVTLPGNQRQVLSQLRAAGLTTYADLSIDHGVIYDENGYPLHILKVSGNRCILESVSKGFHVPMFMQGGPIQQFFAGKPPYTELKRILVRKKKKYYAEALSRIEQDE